VRTTARPAPDREAPDLELVGDGGYVGDAVDYPATRMTTRAPITGAVVADKTETRSAHARRVWMAPAQPTARGPVDHEDRRSRGITDLLIGQRASVDSCDNSNGHLAGEFTITMRPG
jgi:hypothetical protein